MECSINIDEIPWVAAVVTCYCFLVGFLPRCSIHCWERRVETSNCNSVFVYLSLQLDQVSCGYFLDFMLSLVFKSFVGMCLAMDFFGLSCVGFAQLLEALSFYLSPNLGSFQPYFFQDFSSLALFLLSFWDSDDLNFLFYFLL